MKKILKLKGLVLLSVTLGFLFFDLGRSTPYVLIFLCLAGSIDGLIQIDEYTNRVVKWRQHIGMKSSNKKPIKIIGIFACWSIIIISIYILIVVLAREYEIQNLHACKSVVID